MRLGSLHGTPTRLFTISIGFWIATEGTLAAEPVTHAGAPSPTIATQPKTATAPPTVANKPSAATPKATPPPVTATGAPPADPKTSSTGTPGDETSGDGAAITAIVGKKKLSYWDQGEPRFFVASRLELGVYGKAQAAVGYGRPYWLSTTAEVFAISTLSFFGAYAGIRGSLPFLDLRLGTRYSYSYFRSFLVPQESYVKDDVNSTHGQPHAHYQTLEAELTGILPVLAGYVFPVITVYNIIDAPDDKFIFDESLRGIANPPWILGFRLGYVKTFGPHDFIKVGALTEFIVLPGRDGNILRVGPAAQVGITNHLDAQGTITVAVTSPDSLGLWNSSFGQLGVIYRWATGDESPHFP